MLVMVRKASQSNGISPQPAGSERVSRVSCLPASLESLWGGASTAVCYPALEKMLQLAAGEGEMLKAILSIIQQPELPAAHWSQREAPARAPRLSLPVLGEDWFQEAQRGLATEVLAP